MITSQLLGAACALVSASTNVGPGDAAQAPGGPPAAPAKAEERPWTFDAFVYYWSASVSGSLTIDGQEIDLGGTGDGFTGDVALSGFLGDFEAHHGPWSFALAPIFVNIDATGTESGGVGADVSIRAQIHEGFVAHDLGPSWEWLAGARYYSLDTDVDPSVGGSFGNDHSWVDPIVGVRYRQDLGEHWTFRARADVGGFGVGSDFAWNASALFGYRFNSTCAAQIGYRALDVNFASGPASDRLAYDITMNGPILGLSFSF